MAAVEFIFGLFAGCKDMVPALRCSMFNQRGRMSRTLRESKVENSLIKAIFEQQDRAK